MAIDLIGIGKRIRKVRGTRTGVEFGKLLGVGNNMVSVYESGQTWPKPQTLDKIIELSGKPADWLLYGKGDDAGGIVSELPEEYPAATPEERRLLDILKEDPQAKEGLEAMIALPPRKRTIYLGKMFEDLEKLTEEKEKE